MLSQKKNKQKKITKLTFTHTSTGISFAAILVMLPNDRHLMYSKAYGHSKLGYSGRKGLFQRVKLLRKSSTLKSVTPRKWSKAHRNGLTTEIAYLWAFTKIGIPKSKCCWGHNTKYVIISTGVVSSWSSTTQLLWRHSKMVILASSKKFSRWIRAIRYFYFSYFGVPPL